MWVIYACLSIVFGMLFVIYAVAVQICDEIDSLKGSKKIENGFANFVILLCVVFCIICGLRAISLFPWTLDIIPREI